MRNHKHLGKIFFVAALIGVGVFGAFSAPTQARPGCICPMYYAPVRCDNGVIYSNTCFASCAHATGCVPIGGPVPY